MTEQELEEQLRAWYRVRVSDNTVPADLRARVAAIPRSPRIAKANGRRGWLLLVAAILTTAALIAAAFAGGGLRRNAVVELRPSLESSTVPPSTSPSPSTVDTDRWTPTGSMGQARYLHTATLLEDGRVLVAGGHAEGPPGKSLKAVEFYDPTSGIWTSGPDMTSRRSAQTATLLADGKVLVAGGYDDFGALRTAEIFDPSTESWIPTGSMIFARGYHAAALLPDGRVLVAGGRSNNSSTGRPLWDAELYDPRTGTWTWAADMARTRAFPTATLLENGQVLIAGAGLDRDRVDTRASAELYNPYGNAWTATAAMADARVDHTAVRLLDGRVLVIGGRDSVTASLDPGTAGVLSSAEVYDPASQAWVTTKALTQPRVWSSSTLLRDGNVLVAGGDANANIGIGTSTASVDMGSATAELFDPATGAWGLTPKMLGARELHTAVLLPDGRVLVVGGSSGGTALSTAELYVPRAGS